jgi:hypothetical protein
MAEGVRFELTRGAKPLPVFKTGALNHSATLPYCFSATYQETVTICYWVC